jgi:ABC-type phosphate transport system substrate-binding protein
MTKKLYIVFAVLGLCACASQMPLDDAYIYPDKTTPNTQSTPNTQISQSPQPATPAPTMEIVSQKDTTITVKIHR